MSKLTTYDLFGRKEIKSNQLDTVNYDVFVSAYNASDRVNHVFKAISALEKIWLLQPEYGLSLKSKDTYNIFEGEEACNEASFVTGFWKQFGGHLQNKRVCIDITGFIRPNLMCLVRFLHQKGVSNYDMIYSEPDAYIEGENTNFASKSITGVRTIEGYGGSHIGDTSKDILIVGAGYDHHLISSVAENRNHAKKIQLLGLPSLRADMFQENLLKIAKSEEYLGSISQGNLNTIYAPAYDPFQTALEISKLVKSERKHDKLSNLYLSPLSSKPQTLGFALYYIIECIDKPVSAIFPFCESYNESTSVGISRIWQYNIALGKVPLR